MAGENRRTDRVSIFMRADAFDIYAALTDRLAVSEWLPPEGTIGKIEKFEPYVGGRFHMALYFQGSAAKGKTTDSSDRIDARFTALEPGRLVRWAVQFVSHDPSFAGTMTMSWKLTARDNGTEVHIIAEDVPPGIEPEGHRVGLQSSLEQLARHVTRVH